MIDVDGVIFFLGGDGLNSSLNLDTFVSATLFFRANGRGLLSSAISTADSCALVIFKMPCGWAGLDISCLSLGKEFERLCFLGAFDEILNV